MNSVKQAQMIIILRAIFGKQLTKCWKVDLVALSWQLDHIQEYFNAYRKLKMQNGVVNILVAHMRLAIRFFLPTAKRVNSIGGVQKS